MKYDVSAFIKKYSVLNAGQILKDLTVEVTNLETAWRYVKANTTEYRELEIYKDCADSLLFYLNTRVIPSPKTAHDMQALVPIIKNLVDRGELSKTMLDKISV